MRTSSEGKQASLEGKLYPQDENVAEVDTVRLKMSNPRIPIINLPPTIANEAVRRAGFEVAVTPCPATRSTCYESHGGDKVYATESSSLKRGTPRQGF